MRIKFGKDCIGCGACTAECPEVFEFDPDVYRVKVNISANPDDYAAAIRAATAVCPADNIEILES